MPKNRTRRKKPNENGGKRRSGTASDANVTGAVAAGTEEIGIEGSGETASGTEGGTVKRKMKTTADRAPPTAGHALRWLLLLLRRLRPEVVPVIGLNQSLGLRGVPRRITCVRRRRRRKH